MRGAAQADKMLPGFMQLNAQNPLFAPNAGQDYANKYFDQAIAPNLGSAAEQQWLGGNLGTSGSSTFGANYLGNMEASGRNQSFFAGQDYLNQQIGNMLNERSNYFGNDVGLSQGQANLGSQLSQQAQMANASNSLGAQEFNNSYALNQGQAAGSQMNNQYNQQLQYQAAKAQNMSNLFTGGLSSVLGLGGLFGGSSMGKSLGSGLTNMFTGGPSASSAYKPMFGSSGGNESGVYSVGGGYPTKPFLNF